MDVAHLRHLQFVEVFYNQDCIQKITRSQWKKWISFYTNIYNS